jgi:hypothetical protein
MSKENTQSFLNDKYYQMGRTVKDISKNLESLTAYSELMKKVYNLGWELNKLEIDAEDELIRILEMIKYDMVQITFPHKWEVKNIEEK